MSVPDRLAVGDRVPVTGRPRTAGSRSPTPTVIAASSKDGYWTAVYKGSFNHPRSNQPADEVDVR